MDDRITDNDTPLKSLLSQISSQIESVRDGNAIGENNFAQIAKNFAMLKELNATEEETLDDDILTQTMHNMVQSVTLGNEGHRSNLMFLPNKQGAHSPETFLQIVTTQRYSILRSPNNAMRHFQ